MTSGGNQPKPPIRSGTLPGVSAGVSPSAADATRKLIPAAAGSRPQIPPAPQTPKPTDISREEMRGIATAIARSEASKVRDDLATRMTRIEERLDALERKPVTPPPLPEWATRPVPPAPNTAPLLQPAPVVQPTPPPVAVAPPAFIAPAPAPAPVLVAPAPPPSVPIDLASLSHNTHSDDLDDNPFANAHRRRKRVVVMFIMLLVLAVGGIVVAAAVSQSINNHSSSH